MLVNKKMREYAFNRTVRKTDKANKVGKIDETRLTEVLDALVKTGLVVQNKDGLYHLAPDVKNEKIEKMLVKINAKLAQIRKPQTPAKTCVLPRRLPVLR